MRTNGSPRTFRLALVVVGVAGCALGVAQRAEAGIIIKNNGNVFIGKIEPEGFKDSKGKICAREDYDTITMKSPQQYKGQPPLHGEMVFQRNEVRWFDPNSDEPTDEYMKLHADDHLDPKWYALYVAPWKEARNNQVQIQPLTSFADFNTASLVVTRTTRLWGGDEASIRRPTGWTQLPEAGGITMFQSDAKGTDGYAPRIHFFSTEAAIGQPSDQLNWIKQELEKLANTPDAFEIKGDNPGPTSERGGHKVELTTLTRRQGKPIKALRTMRFRDHRAYFITCYAHEKDFDKHLTIFHQVIGSLVINEAGAPAATVSDIPDAAAVTVGQVYRWKSQSNPDEIVWEVMAKEANKDAVVTVRHRTTKPLADGTKHVGEDTESLVALDPLQRMTALAGAPATPSKVGKEALVVAGQSFDCDVYEAQANGKKYKLWLSKKFPMEIKLTVDGQLTKELSEIK